LDSAFAPKRHQSVSARAAMAATKARVCRSRAGRFGDVFNASEDVLQDAHRHVVRDKVQNVVAPERLPYGFPEMMAAAEEDL
jgi:hypothetical protein